MKIALAVAVCLVVPIAFVAAQQPSPPQKEKPENSQAMCPMHEAHTQGNSSATTPATTMDQRGEEGMGFSQTATTHHFFMKHHGGVIQVEVKDPADSSDRASIRVHLAHIAQAFANGDFDIPMLVHGGLPPGVPVMKQLREKISYSFEETPDGGRVTITTHDKEALGAIHSFLRFQIQEHKTGDPAEMP